MPYIPKNRLGPERARLRDTYPGLNIVKSRHDPRKLFIYYQPQGRQRVRLNADPYKQPAEFRAEYEAAKRGEPKPEPEPARRSRVGTWNAAIDDYKASAKYLSKADNTKRLYAPFIDAVSRVVGGKLMRQTDPWDIYEMHNGVLSRDSAVQANQLLTVLSGIIHIGRLRRWVPPNVDLLLGIEHQQVTSTSFRPYADDEIERWRQHHPMGTMARAAFELAYGLALGSSDLIRLAPCHIDDLGNVWIARKKTGTTQTSNVRSDPVLRAVFEQLPPSPPDAPVDVAGRSTAPFLRNQHGKPFAEDGSTLRKQWRRWATEAGLPADFVVHGARSTLVVDMMDAGVANSDGMRRTGHLDERVYKRVYGAQASATKAASRAQDQVTAARQRKAGKPGKSALRAVGS